MTNHKNITSKGNEDRWKPKGKVPERLQPRKDSAKIVGKPRDAKYAAKVAKPARKVAPSGIRTWLARNKVD